MNSPRTRGLETSLRCNGRTRARFFVLEGAEGLTPTALPLSRAVDVLHIHSLLLQQYSVDSAAVVVVQPQITLTIRLQESCAPLQLGLPLLQDAVNAKKFVVACQ